METEEMELDEEWWGSQAIYMENYGMDLYAITCRPEEMKCHGPTVSIMQIPCRVAD